MNIKIIEGITVGRNKEKDSERLNIEKGDRVRLASNDYTKKVYPDYIVGNTGVVIGDTGNTYKVWFGDNDIYSIFIGNLRRVGPKKSFEVGDKVKVISGEYSASHLGGELWEYNNEVGEVIIVHDRTKTCKIDFPDEDLWFAFCDLEKV